MVLAVVLAVAIGSLAVLAILAVSLLRHVKVLTASLRRFQEETQPVLLELQRSTASASQRGAELKGAGGRLRR
jgi:hypothetical protein